MILTPENIKKLADEEFATGNYLWKYQAIDAVAEREGWSKTNAQGYYYKKKKGKILPKDMKIQVKEFYVMYQALEARKRWIEDDGEAPQEELPFIKSLMDKIDMLNIQVDIQEDAKK